MAPTRALHAAPQLWAIGTGRAPTKALRVPFGSRAKDESEGRSTKARAEERGGQLAPPDAIEKALTRSRRPGEARYAEPFERAQASLYEFGLDTACGSSIGKLTSAKKSAIPPRSGKIIKRLIDPRTDRKELTGRL